MKTWFTVFRQPSGPNMLLFTHHLHTWYSTTHVLGGRHQFTHGAGCKICDAWNRVNRVINQLTRVLGAQRGGGAACRMNCKATECGCFRWLKAPIFLPSGHWQRGLKYPAESQRFQCERLKRLHRNKRWLKRTLQFRAAKFTMSVKLPPCLHGLFFSPCLSEACDRFLKIHCIYLLHMMPCFNMWIRSSCGNGSIHASAIPDRSMMYP